MRLCFANLLPLGQSVLSGSMKQVVAITLVTVKNPAKEICLRDRQRDYESAVIQNEMKKAGSLGFTVIRRYL